MMEETSMKVLILGGVAAGTKTAAKWKRMDRSAQVTVLTRDSEISYAGCGLPYYVGGLIEERDELIVNTPAQYAALTGVQVLTGWEAFHVDPAKKAVSARNVRTGEESTYDYDKLVIAVGASAVKPPVPGTDKQGVFVMRTPDDAEAIRTYVKENSVRRAVVIGGSFIGLEAAENLQTLGLTVTVADMASQLLPGVLDEEMAGYVRRHLVKAGMRVMTGAALQSIEGEDKVQGASIAGQKIPCELVVLAVGIRPNTAFLQDTGLTMEKGAICVDEHLMTNLPDIFAVGDCALVTNRLTGARQWSPMGSSANMEGRTLALSQAGRGVSYPGVLGTGVVKMPGLNAGRTGLTQAQAEKAGYQVETVVAVTDDKAHYYPDAGIFVTKLIADKATHKLLGVQVLGPGAVDKMVDIAVMGLNMGATLEDFDNGDFAYAPPFSTAIHPFVQAVYMLENKLSGDMVSMTPAEYAAGKAKGWTVIDANKVPTIRGAKFVDLTKVEGPIDGLDLQENLLLVCARGKRAYFLQNRMRKAGYTNTYVLEGATTFNDVKVASAGAAVSPEDVTRVKALGFLWDKNTPDCFNGRVITRNGRITADEAKVIAEAAEEFGNGYVTMTSRLTMEIQGVPYDNIEPLREKLMQAGLETGGTGSKVRPVVSCKGTTCQYGLIDTFSLSEEIHERFFHGYSDVKLPHKFKIAVGGCPNNCVKPDLNDLGIIGQRVPQIDYAKCRGCKVCQVENTCPIHVAHVENGKITVDDNACNHCGRCLHKCPFGAFEEAVNGYRIYIGGRWGKKVAHGRYLSPVFTSREEVLDIVEKAILLFREQGITGERFADTVERLGFENVQAQLLDNALLSRKDENLKAQKHLKGGATC